MAGALNLYFQWPILYTLPAATLGGALLCTVLLAPVIRLKGVYFAMVTIVIPILFSRTIVAGSIFGGTHGLVNLSPFASDRFAEYFILFALLFCLFAFRRVIGED